MLTPILATKLYIPSPRPKVVVRPRLIARLNEGLLRKLTLISAPAGFGKTTLVSEWVAGCEQRVAWLSLNKEDSEPIRFLTYFVAALQTIVPNIGEGVLGVLQSPQPPSIEIILTALLNEIASVPNNFVLVLDDYHLIDAKSVDHALTFLLDHLPRQMHLVIATREDPQLPLSRLRVRGQLTELRVADLRFILSEVAGFLNQVMGLTLSAEDITALETRTEGWIAGLQLAAISMQGHPDTTRFIKSFTGSHHFVLDYLVEEVLHQQSESVQTFLLHTSILDRLCGPLCDAVLRDPAASGQTTLEYLEHANLLVVAMDDKRQWYRYHHLFADVLQARLMREQSNQVAILHVRASEWYEQNDLRFSAIHHALAAKDFRWAAGLIELAWPAMDGSFQSTQWLGWVMALPDELVRARPVLSVGYAWAFLDEGILESAEARLQDAERWLESIATVNGLPEARPTKMVVVDEAQFRSLPASIATARAYRALALGDVPSTINHARRALDVLPEGDHRWRGAAASLLGIAYWANGDLESAHRSLADFMANMQKIGNISDIISVTFIIADIMMALGRLREAVGIYQKSLQIAMSQGEPMPLGTADLHRGISELSCELGNLEDATHHLQTSKQLGEQDALPNWQHRLCLTQARIKESKGDLTGALELLDNAERLYIRTPLPDVRPIAALKTRIWVMQGRLSEALGWVRERGLSVNDDLSYLHEFEHITLSRVLIAQYKNDLVDFCIHEAMRLLERLLLAAEAGGRIGSMIEILVLQALTHEAQGNISTALVTLKRALKLAEPEGYVRLFVNEGPPMAELLREAAKHGAAANYISRLRAAFAKAEDRPLVTQVLIDPLSKRELEVLNLFKTELNGPEIAHELMVSLNTVRTHTKNIYSKLGVNNRRAAVRRAEELDLL
ncbi:MAG: helix-turn-helix transcriptional regulator [Verrucomicrobia bacterium]|nr:helix-turn-helix transcriptional regulator [Leptolyngbya sp. ES-bin-22]